MESILGEDGVEGIRVKNVKTDETKDLDLEGFFVAIGIRPNSGLGVGKVEITDDGFILADENMATNVEGVYAIGDVRLKPVWQLVTAASDGAIGTLSAQRYIMENFDN